VGTLARTLARGWAPTQNGLSWLQHRPYQIIWRGCRVHAAGAQRRSA